MMRLLLLAVLFCSKASWAFNVLPKGHSANNEGVHLLEEEKNHQAYQNFVKALGENPFDPYIQMNLGFAFLRNEEKEKALKQMEAAEKLSHGDDQAHFMALFNTASLKSAAGDIDGALTSYQAALELRPDSKEVKTNIELLWQQQNQGKGKSDQQQKKDDQQQGDNKQQSENDKEQKNDPSQGQQPEEKKDQKPKSFESKDLSQEDVRKILEELKNQEQAIRADAYQKGAKDAPRDKDW